VFLNIFNLKMTHVTGTYCFDMIRYDIYLTAIGLTPGGSSTVHIYIQTTQNTENGTYITIKKLTYVTVKKLTDLGSEGRAPRL
jgi:hypothetical protein